MTHNVGVWVIGDQLHPRQAALRRYPHAPVCMVESRGFCTRRPWHWQKLVLVLSAMRHFAADLRASGRIVHYTKLAPDPPTVERSTSPDFVDALTQFVSHYKLTKLAMLEPAGYEWLAILKMLQERLGVPIERIDSDLFIATPAEFADWAGHRSGRLVMENWYRHIRTKENLLITSDGAPVGGRWNFDKENRRVPTRAVFPSPPSYPPDEVTREVEQLVRHSLMPPGPHQPGCFGNPASPFQWPVTRQDALHTLDEFLAQRFAAFGPFEDAMHTESWMLWHSGLSSSMNLGLLTAREVVAAAVEFAHRRAGTPHEVPLNSLEGFVRQIVGWREYMRGVYWLWMPEYREMNALGATAALPQFYWDANTDLACLQHACQGVVDRGYAHHIQRLMVLSNFAMLLGIDPLEVAEWFIFGFIDGHEWVVLGNTIGMSLHADGGKVATKPYAASASYINKMSNYCRNCRYDPKKRLGEDACPFNAAYWTFLDRHRERFASNQRMLMMVSNLERIEPAEKRKLRAATEALQARLQPADWQFRTHGRYTL